MGSVYKRKRRSCKMCKPHKMGWAPKKKLKEIQLIKEFKKELKEKE
jgi:hypothetical protein